jgi:hypothetical protein
VTTWTDAPPERQQPGTQPRPALSRLLAALFTPAEPDPGLEVYGPCDRIAEAGS